MIREQAKALVNTQRLSAKDALHLAAAIESRADVFVTCDDVFLNRAKRASLGIALMNPVEYVHRAT